MGGPHQNAPPLAPGSKGMRAVTDPSAGIRSIYTRATYGPNHLKFAMKLDWVHRLIP